VPAHAELACKLVGPNLFSRLDRRRSEFTHPVTVPEGFLAGRFPYRIRRPDRLYVKLRTIRRSSIRRC